MTDRTMTAFLDFPQYSFIADISRTIVSLQVLQWQILIWHFDPLQWLLNNSYIVGTIDI